MKRRSVLLLLCCVLLLAPTETLFATSIVFEATPLGGSQWQYSYWVSDRVFDEGYGFTVYFDYGLYENISPVSASAEWDTLAWEPDPWLGPGAYDALALVDAASLTEAFVVMFDWLGTGAPGAQVFEVYCLAPEFTIVESGTTAPAPVPEPGTVVLLGFGLSGLVGFRKFFKRP